MAIKRYSLFLVISIILGLIVNQIAIQYYLSDFYQYTMFAKFISPAMAYKTTMEFFRETAKYEDSGENIIIITLLGVFISYVICLVIYRKFFGKDLSSDRHGSAKIEDISAIEKDGLLQDPEIMHKVEKRYGFIIGAIEHSSGRTMNRYDTNAVVKLRWLMHYGQQHVLLIAPTGGGKGVGYVTPNLLNYQGSVFMYDMKGKDWETTAGYRSKVLGQLCIKFEPTNGDGTSCKYNPMEFIAVGTPREVSEAGNLALMLVDSDGKGIDNDHFKSNGTKLLGAAILHVLYTKKAKNLSSVAALLSGINPDTNTAYSGGVKDWLGEMCGEGPNRKSNPSHLQCYIKERGITEEEGKQQLGNLIDQFGYHKSIKQVAASLFNNNGEKEVSGIISSANTPLSLFNDPIVAENTAKSTINLKDFQCADKAVSLYVVVMPTDQDRIRPITRILLTQLINTVQATEHGKKRELGFYLDEFATLKKMQVVATALATIRSFKARFFIVIQDLSQLDEYYDKLASSIISNCGIRIGLPSNDSKTNEQLAKWTGEYTYVAETTNSTVQRQAGFNFGGGSISTTTSRQESQRTLLTSNEVQTMDKRMLVFREGKNVIYGHSYNYREDRTMDDKLNLPLPV